ncbi:MAG: hypothetical protein H0U22_17535 [Geodermatophilaceae bacterium]|nr:hypothetical protein [Geodermatophilaceae bacterium]
MSDVPGTLMLCGAALGLSSRRREC